MVTEASSGEEDDDDDAFSRQQGKFMNYKRLPKYKQY